MARPSSAGRREAEATNPRLLFLAESDIAASEAALEAERFPDHLAAGPVVVPLRYRFDPGNEDDGVSALVPLHVLNQLPEEPFAWLVPGLFDEKITALVRALPKALRVNFVPVPDAVARVMPLLDIGRGSLHAQLADALSRVGGIRVPRDSFREDVLPTHLRMNFLLVNEAGDVLARARSLAELRARHAGALTAGLCEVVAAHQRCASLGVRRHPRTAAGWRGSAQPNGLSRAGG